MAAETRHIDGFPNTYSDTPADKAVGILKGFVWPAFLVYEAFSVVAGRPESSE